jgi:signal peptidase II
VPGPAQPERTGPARRWAIVAGAAAVVLALDQLTKWWAVARLCGPPYCPDAPARTPVELVWTLQLRYAENTGMAFSKGEGWGRVIGLVALAIVAVLLLAARRMTSGLQLVLVGVVVGGALGNLVDRVARADDGFLSGAVVDFIDLQWWPIFNVADAAVVVGGILLALTSLREPAPPPAMSAEPEPPSPTGDPPRGSARGG